MTSILHFLDNDDAPKGLSAKGRCYELKLLREGKEVGLISLDDRNICINCKEYRVRSRITKKDLFPCTEPWTSSLSNKEKQKRILHREIAVNEMVWADIHQKFAEQEQEGSGQNQESRKRQTTTRRTRRRGQRRGRPLSPVLVQQAPRYHHRRDVKRLKTISSHPSTKNVQSPMKIVFKSVSKFASGIFSQGGKNNGTTPATQQLSPDHFENTSTTSPIATPKSIKCQQNSTNVESERLNISKTPLLVRRSSYQQQQHHDDVNTFTTPPNKNHKHSARPRNKSTPENSRTKRTPFKNVLLSSVSKLSRRIMFSLKKKSSNTTTSSSRGTPSPADDQQQQHQVQCCMQCESPESLKFGGRAPAADSPMLALGTLQNSTSQENEGREVYRHHTNSPGPTTKGVLVADCSFPTDLSSCSSHDGSNSFNGYYEYESSSSENSKPKNYNCNLFKFENNTPDGEDESDLELLEESKEEEDDLLVLEEEEMQPSSSKKQPRKKPDKYGILKKYGLPLSDHAEMKVILRKLFKYITEHCSSEELEPYPTECGGMCISVAVKGGKYHRHYLELKESNTKCSFEKKGNLRNICKIPRLLLSSYSVDCDERDEGYNKDLLTKAYWVLKCLAKEYPEVFKKAAAEIHNMTALKPLSVTKTIAMLKHCGINAKKAQRMRSMLYTYFEVQILASHNSVQEYRNKIEIPDLETGVYEQEDGQTTVRFSQVKIVQTVLAEVRRYINAPGSDPSKIKRIYLQFGGDHGQENSYVNILKVICMDGLDSYAKCMDCCEFQLSHIDAKKDDYEILVNTIALGLKDMMDHIAKSPGLEITIDKENHGVSDVRMMEVDEYHNIAEEQQQEQQMGQSRTEPESDSSEPLETVLQPESEPIIKIKIPIVMLMTGDLKFISMVTGKVNMDSKWCPWCDANPRRKGEGSTFLTREGGIRWTNESMKAKLEENCKRPDHRMGVTHESLMPSVDISNIIFPPLHCITLLVAPEIDIQLMQVLIDQHAEDIPEIHSKRTEYEEARYPGDGRIPDRVKVARLKREYSKLLKNVDPIHQKVRNKVEALYKNKGLDRGSFFGGKLQGPQARVLMQKANELFPEIGAVLKEGKEGREGFLGSERIIDDIMERYIELLTLTDYLISLCYHKCGTLTDDQLKTANDLIDCLFRLWTELGLSLEKIKIHCILAHLLFYLSRFRGLLEFTEDSIERHHQTRKRHEELVKGLKNYGKKQRHYHTEEALTRDKGVCEAQILYTERRKKYRKKNNNEHDYYENRKLREEILQRVLRRIEDKEPIRDWYIHKPLPIDRSKDK